MEKYPLKSAVPFDTFSIFQEATVHISPVMVLSNSWI
jgi:hypothetical protein